MPLFHFTFSSFHFQVFPQKKGRFIFRKYIVNNICHSVNVHFDDKCYHNPCYETNTGNVFVYHSPNAYMYFQWTFCADESLISARHHHKLSKTKTFFANGEKQEIYWQWNWWTWWKFVQYRSESLRIIVASIQSKNVAILTLWSANINPYLMENRYPRMREIELCRFRRRIKWWYFGQYLQTVRDDPASALDGGTRTFVRSKALQVNSFTS